MVVAILALSPLLPRARTGVSPALPWNALGCVGAGAPALYRRSSLAGTRQSSADESEESSTGRLEDETDGCFPHCGANAGSGVLGAGSSGQWFITEVSPSSDRAKSSSKQDPASNPKYSIEQGRASAGRPASPPTPTCNNQQHSNNCQQNARDSLETGESRTNTRQREDRSDHTQPGSNMGMSRGLKTIVDSVTSLAERMDGLPDRLDKLCELFPITGQSPSSCSPSSTLRSPSTKHKVRR
ncbi:hypothetical protein O3P69_006208 [Scylla paramamosain]|uniref:Uncharacterized protein n=1 Tax=Scylla paramamosain TaxID=85552 RepID=A0AAW0U5Q6_SCYPA